LITFIVVITLTVHFTASTPMLITQIW